MFNFFKSQKQKDEEMAQAVNRLHDIAIENQKSQMQKAMMMKMSKAQVYGSAGSTSGGNGGGGGGSGTGGNSYSKAFSTHPNGFSGHTFIQPGQIIQGYVDENGQFRNLHGCTKCGHMSDIKSKYCDLCNEPMIEVNANHNFTASYGIN